MASVTISISLYQYFASCERLSGFSLLAVRPPIRQLIPRPSTRETDVFFTSGHPATAAVVTPFRVPGDDTCLARSASGALRSRRVMWSRLLIHDISLHRSLSLPPPTCPPTPTWRRREPDIWESVKGKLCRLLVVPRVIIYH